MNYYINTKIYGLPVPTKTGHNTSPNKLRKDLEYIHKVHIRGSDYYKVHLKRQGISKIKYFSKLKEAKLFVEFLRLNKYL
jgi:hypothetical protein